MRRRALLRSGALALVAGAAGCGGTGPDSTTESTTTTTSPSGTPTDTTDRTTTTEASLTTATNRIDAALDQLKLQVEELPADEDWSLVRADEDTTRFNRQVELTDYKVVASVLAHEDLEAALTAFENERDRADAYTGITVHELGLGTEAFGYQLTRVEGTIVFRDTNVVGKLTYGIDEYTDPEGVSISLSAVKGYASRWHDTWR